MVGPRPPTTDGPPSDRYRSGVADADDSPQPAGGHYFSTQPAVASRPREVTLALPDTHLTLATDRGVFSGERVDPGTKLLLLEGRSPEPEARVLADIGCGYGPIAVTVALRAPHATVWAVDVNARARELCRVNAERAGVAERVRVVAPEEVPVDLRLDGIWSNPPIRIGTPALHDLLIGWLDRLHPGATATLVVQKNLGADSLARWLAERGFTVQRAATGAGYRLLDVRSNGPRPHDDEAHA